MKILIIRMIAIEQDFSDQTYNTQGVGLAAALSRLGHQCGLVYYAKKGNAFNEVIERSGFKIPVYHIEGLNIVWNAIYNSSIYDICDKYDVIQVSECDQIFSWILYKRYPHKVVIYHGPYRSKYTWKYNLRASVFDKIFTWRAGFRNAQVLSKSCLAEEYLRRKGFQNVVTVGVGLNPDYIDVPIERDKLPETIKNTLSTKNNSKYILFIGAISKRKNVKFVIEILNHLVNKEHKTDYKLLIIGDKAYKEDDYYNDCMRMIQDCRLKNNVIILGRVEQKYLKTVYEMSDVYVLPTRYDIFGMVYLEALYFGLPVVTTYCGGSSMLIKEGETGFIRELDDCGAWADAIKKICGNAQEFHDMKEKSKNLIRDHYTWDKIAPKFVEAYKKTKGND